MNRTGIMAAGVGAGILLTLFAHASVLPQGKDHEIPFRIESNLIVAPATINGKGPVKFAIDTGTDHNQLLPGAAKRVGLDRANPVGSLLLGSAESADEYFLVENHPGLINVNRLAGIEGTIGYPFLRKFRMILDYKQKKIFLKRYDDEKAFPQLKELIKRKDDVKSLFDEKKLKEAAEELEKIFDKAPKGSELASNAIFNAARTYSMLGDAEKVVATLQKMRQAGFRFSHWVQGDKVFEKVQENSKFQELLKTDKPDSKKIYFDNDRDHIVFEGTLNGKGPFKFLLDTGSSYVTITPEVRSQLGLKQKTLQSVKIGGTELKNVQVDWSSPIVGMMKQFGTQVLVGTTFLSSYRITIDFLNQEITLDPN